MDSAGPVPAKPLRLFIGLWPDASLRAAIAAWQRQWAWPPQAGVVRAERLHLTMHFLGDVPADRLPELQQGLAVPFHPFELALGRGEVWPHGVAVLRPDEDPPALLALHSALRRVLAGLQIPVEERLYRPHVTLARRAQGAKTPAQQAGLRWQADAGYVLVQSLPGGAGYKVLRAFN